MAAWRRGARGVEIEAARIVANIELCGVPPRELHDFVRVSSEFYPQLSTYYERRIHAWFEANYPERPDEED